jgi:ABC-type nickel/cobalt efflux system permease component RcnA
MTGIIRHLKTNLIQWVALGVLVAAMLSASRAAFIPILMNISRFLVPILVIWLIYRFLKGRLETAVKRFQDQMMQNFQNSGQGFPGGHGAGKQAGRGGQEVLDLCPKCGVLQTATHRCS